MQCTNYTKCIQMLIVSHVVIDVCFLYTKQLYILYFFNFCANNDDVLRSTFASFQNFRTSFCMFKTIYKQSYIKNFIICSNIFNFLIAIFFTEIFFKTCFLTYCLLELKSFVLNLNIIFSSENKR